MSECVCERERESECVCVSVCVCESVCVCVRERERERERESERETEHRGGESERASVGRQRESVGDKETTRVSERPIAVKKSLRRREHRV